MLHFFTGRQYKIKLYFSLSRLTVQTYGSIQLTLIDKNGLNETVKLTR